MSFTGILKFFFVLILMSMNTVVFSQDSQKKSSTAISFSFKKNSDELYGLSTNFSESAVSFDTITDPKGNKVPLAVKSLPLNKEGSVLFQVTNLTRKKIETIKFIQSGSRKYLEGKNLGDSLISIKLPAATDDYTIYAFFENNLVAALKVQMLEVIREKVIVVPMVEFPINADSLQKNWNNIFRQALLELDVNLKPIFKLSKRDEIQQMTNPLSTDQYTEQMRLIRDTYFKRFPEADRSAFYLFITPSFVNNSPDGFCVKSKSVSFIPVDTSVRFLRNSARVLAQSIGFLKIKKERSSNLMASGNGVELNFLQWVELRHNSHTFSIYDNYEDVKTNNGSVAYYFWREDAKGNILLEPEGLMHSIKRPFKKNFISYHLDIDEFMFLPRLVLWGREFCFWHVLVLISVWPVLFNLRGRILKKIYRKLRKPSFWRILSVWIVLLATILFTYLFFDLIEKGYERFEVKTGLLKDLGAKNTEQAIEEILHNVNFRQRSESRLRSEILIRRKGKWHVKKRKQVLYFDLHVDEEGLPVKAKFVGDNDSLILNQYNYRVKSRSHYLVVNVLNTRGKLIEQRLFNHSGSELIDKLDTKDPVHRVLVFVNGYRPTSMGHTFEDNFEDLRNNGLEYPNSANIIYDFDRYDYWHPWNAIDDQFIQRINPSKKFYADGHFSVSTSNHESLVNFTALSAVYPKRCKDPSHHTCYQTTMTSTGWFGSKNKNTKDLLRLDPNYQGFKERYNNGRIAGRSMLQELNEIPNNSENDTLYLVAHSMGYAYALGMLKEMRGKISFGGFYIIAPENASCGRVILDEWKEVWQYGSNFNKGKEDAPCLQDGVAPQVAANGISESNRCYFPSSLYAQKGFFNSHFIGFYSWIFEIPKGQKGHIRQR